MKKILSILLATVMIVSVIPVFADQTMSDAMETALISAKTRIDIPEKFSEFSPFSYEENGKTVYNFRWATEDESSYIQVFCDHLGRINRYYINDNSLRSEKKLTKLSKEEIFEFGETFLEKILPEAFENENDVLINEDKSWSVDNNNYSISYKRIYNNRYVKDNIAFLRISVYNDVPYVQRMEVTYNYDDGFSTETPLESGVDKYIETFPIELIYQDVYSYNGEDDDSKTALVYRIKDNESGFLSALNYEVVVEDENNEIYRYAGMGGGVMENAAMDKAELTAQELKELENIEGLISREEVDKILKNLPSVSLDEKMELSTYNVTQRDDEYLINVRYKESEGNKYLSATLNGVTAKLISLYSDSSYEDLELTDAQKETASQKIDEFVKAVAKEEYAQCKEQGANSTGNEYTKDFDRYVNGIRYISDGIDVKYNVNTGNISSYRLDFEDGKIFEQPVNTVSPETAYKSLLEVSPVENVWVMSDGVYLPCWTLGRYGVEIDAFTGKEYIENANIQQDSYQYSDIGGHWAEEKINKLAEIQIGFEGENFYPDAPVTQYDLLRFFAAGIHFKSYLTYPQNMLYENFIYDGILTEEEKNPEGQVLREDAFVYMVRLDGLDKVAKLSDIFKVEYADGNLLSEGKIGYPAILTGMNVICGNGGYLKPKTPITRAEAAVMVYNYMINE